MSAAKIDLLNNYSFEKFRCAPFPSRTIHIERREKSHAKVTQLVCLNASLI